jgi:hypothetical protein
MGAAKGRDGAVLLAILPGVWRWAAPDPAGGPARVGHVLADGEGSVWIDPPPVPGGRRSWQDLPAPLAILLTSAAHDRASGALRSWLGVPLWAPEEARAELAEAGLAVDVGFAEGDLLPLGLTAHRTVLAGRREYAFWQERLRYLFVGEALYFAGTRMEIGARARGRAWDETSCREELARWVERQPRALFAGHGEDVLEDAWRGLTALNMGQQDA